MIPFEKPAPRVVSKENRLSFKVRSNPDQKDSLQYELNTYTFSDGPAEEWFETCEDLLETGEGAEH